MTEFLVFKSCPSKKCLNTYEWIMKNRCVTIFIRTKVEEKIDEDKIY